MNSSIALEITKTYWHRRTLLLASFIASLLVGFVYAWFIAKPLYSSTLTFFPPSGSSIGGLGGLLSDRFPGTTMDRPDLSPEQILAMSESDWLAKDVVQKFELVKKYEFTGKHPEVFRAVKKLRKRIGVTYRESGGFGVSSITTISIRAEDEDPTLARDMAAYIFKRIDSAVIAIRVRKYREEMQFLKQRLDSAVAIQSALQDSLATSLKSNSIVDPASQLAMNLALDGELSSKIAMKQVDLELIKSRDGSGSSRYAVAMEEMAALRRQKALLEKHGVTGKLGVSGKAVDFGVEYANLKLRFELASRLVIALTQQYSGEAMGEMRMISSLAILDAPTVAEYKSKPKRIVLLGIIVVGWNALVILGVAYWVGMKITLKRSKLFAALTGREAKA